MRRLLAALLCLLAVSIPAVAHHGRGAPMPSGGGGGAPSFVTASLASVNVGSTAAQTLSVTCNNAPCTCNQVSAAPNYLLWVYITPNCTVSGTPQMAEQETVTAQVTDATGLSAQRTYTLKTVASGGLAFVSSTTLPSESQNGYFGVPVAMSGGQPPYIFKSSNVVRPCTMTWVGYLECATSTSSLSVSVTGSDSNGNTATQTEAINLDTNLRFRNIDGLDSVIHLPAAMVGAHYTARIWSDGGTGTGKNCTSTGGLPAWATLSTASGVCLITGVPTKAGAFEVSLKVTDSAVNNATATTLTQVLSNGSVARPAYNVSVGNGPFVLGGLIYDKNGFPFHIRGLNQLHYNSSAGSGIPNTAANAVRIWDGGCAIAHYTTLINTYVAAKILPIADVGGIPINSTTCSGAGTSGDQNPGDLAQVVAWWIANAAGFAPYQSEMILDVANEWGPSQSTTWRNSYITATGSISNMSGSTITVSNGGSNPFANSPFAYVAGSCGVADQVVLLTAPAGGAGAWTVQASTPQGPSAMSGSGVTWTITLPTPVRPNTVYVQDAGNPSSRWAFDNGAGSLGSQKGVTSLSVNYATGAVSVTFSGTPSSSVYASSGRTSSFAGYTSGCTLNGGAVGALRAAGYAEPILMDAGSSGQDYTDIFNYAPAIQAADTEQNTIAAYHSYNSSTNFYGVISGVTAGNPTVVTLNSGLAYHPFNPGNSTNGAFSAIGGYYITGAAGGDWTALNGLQISPTNTYVTAGQWQLHLNINSSGFIGSYTPGSGSVVAAAAAGGSNFFDYAWVMTSFASLRSSNVAVIIGEHGPGSRSGDPTNTNCCDGDATPTQIGQVITAAEANGLGYLEWAMDDNNLAGNAASWSAINTSQTCGASVCWFGDTGLNGNNGTFGALTDLTAPGLDIIENGRYGLSALASPAAQFN